MPYMKRNERIRKMEFTYSDSIRDWSLIRWIVSLSIFSREKQRNTSPQSSKIPAISSVIL